MRNRRSFTKEDAKKKVEELKVLVQDVTPEQVLEFSKSWLVGRITFPDAKHYSLYNYIVASVQMQRRGKPGITIIAPFSLWKEKGRSVKKGEKALKILAPIFSKYWEDSDGVVHWVSRKNPAPRSVTVNSICTNFQLVPVFDYSQTEGEPLEGIEKIQGGLKGIWSEGSSDFSLNQIISASAIPVNFYEVSRQGEEGFTNGESISLLDHRDIPEKQEGMISTFLHEWAHCLLHFNQSGQGIPIAQKEVEAETTAFVVGSILGFTSLAAPIYIKGWGAKTKKEPRMEKVLKAVETILNSIFTSEQFQKTA